MKRYPFAFADAQLMRAITCCVLVGVLLFAARIALAQNIESVLAPGKVIEGHAKYEQECAKCHVKFDRKAQDTLCMDCHKEVGSDVRNRAGYHGRIKLQTCRSCHTDHKGRDARPAAFDKKKFDHTQTDFALRGKHKEVACEKCHTERRKFSEAPQPCDSCHRKDDVHKGSLGAKCADCHGETDWKTTRFDHGKTRFALEAKHADVKCADCHKDNRYKETPSTCVACHRTDDDRKGHKRQFGDKCETCHTAKLWEESTFNHDVDTRYSLRGKHQQVKCADCHTGPLYGTKISNDCFACHKKDDKHKDTLGRDCQSCHSERGWKEPAKFDHDTSSFPLLGKHAKAECKSCHKSSLFKEAPKDCYSCHKNDDKHVGTLGKDCAACHVESDWRSTRARFNHDSTRFKLRNAHAEGVLKCNTCHTEARKFRDTPMACVSCHKKDDKHEGQIGEKCEQCHGDRAWKSARFDHARSEFALTGRHITASCKSCHKTLRYKDAPRDCVSCHLKEDKHKARFGTRCESCHNTRSWSTWAYDHEARTSFRLTGAHKTVSCETCHRQPAPKGKAAAVLSTNCASCHRGEDVHEGQFGMRCEQCHVTENWKNVLGRVALPKKETPSKLNQERKLP